MVGFDEVALVIALGGAGEAETVAAAAGEEGVEAAIVWAAVFWGGGVLQKKVISEKEGLEQEFSSTVVGDLQYKLFDPLNAIFFV